MKKNILLISITFIIGQCCFVKYAEAQTWKALGTGISGGLGLVHSLCSYSDSLFAGGQFTKAGTVSVNNIAAWTGTGWSALGSGINAEFSDPGVFAMAVYNGNLYVAGIFDSAGGNTAYDIAEWNGSNWSALGLGIGFGAGDSTSEVYSLAVYDGKLYAAGTFSSAGGHLVNNIAAWNGSTWSAVGAGIGGNDNFPAVQTLLVYNGNLYAGGNFREAGSVLAYNIVQWNGVSYSPLGLGIDTANGGASVFSLAVYDSALYVGGYFDSAGNTPAENIVRWTGTGWLALGSGLGDSITDITAMAVNNGLLYAGGNFQTAGSVAANNIAQWNGITWATLGLGVSADDDVEAAGIYNGNLYVGGYFTKAGSTNASDIAEWETPPTGINEINANTNVSVFPNPSKGFLTFAVENTEATQQLQIYNLTGAKVYQSIMSSAKTDVDLSKDAAGAYLYRIVSASSELISTGKFIIQ